MRRCRPVSYTHLDVYKRQLYLLVTYPAPLIGRREYIPVVLFFCATVLATYVVIYQAIVRMVKPVSYTHLDVYKRQPTAPSAGTRARRSARSGGSPPGGPPPSPPRRCV